MATDDRALKLAVQDRQRLFRDGLAMILETEPDIEVVATAGTATELVAVVTDTPIDVVVLELDVADWDACNLLAALRRRHPEVRVVWTSSAEESCTSARTSQARVGRVVSRAGGVGLFLQAIRSATPGGPVPARRSVVEVQERRPLLTARELQVLAAIGQGANTHGVAAAMGISPKTVENHKQRIFEKLQVQNQTHAVSVALRRGLLEALSLPGRIA